MSTASIKETAFQHKLMTPPFSLLDMMGKHFLEIDEKNSVRNWLGMKWLDVRANDTVKEILRAALADTGKSNLEIDQLWASLQKALGSFGKDIDTLPAEELERIRGELVTTLGLSGSPIDYPNEATLGLWEVKIGVPPFLEPLVEEGKKAGGKIAKGYKSVISDINSIPAVYTVKQFLEDTQEFLEDVGSEVANFVIEQIGAFTDAVRYVVSQFAANLKGVFALFGEGKLDQAFGAIMTTVAGFVSDLVWSGVAVVVNFTLDLVMGICFGKLYGSPLTRREKEIVRLVFGSAVDVTWLRIVSPIVFERPLATTNCIYLPSRDMHNPADVCALIHEVTHIYQDQWSWTANTASATRDQLLAFFDEHLVYSVILEEGTKWHDLKAEHQAALVEDFYKRHILELKYKEAYTYTPLWGEEGYRIARRIMKEQGLYISRI